MTRSKRRFARAVAADQAHRSPVSHGELRAIQERAVAEGEVGIEKCDESHGSDCRGLDAEGKALYSTAPLNQGTRSAPVTLAVCPFRRTSIILITSPRL